MYFDIELYFDVDFHFKFNIDMILIFVIDLYF